MSHERPTEPEPRDARADPAARAGAPPIAPADAAAAAAAAPPAARKKLTRRRFVALALLGGAAALAPLRCGFYDEADALADLERLSPVQGAILLAALEALLPTAADRSPAALRDHVRFIDGYLAHCPPVDARQLGLLLYALEHATTPLELRWRRFSSLAVEERRDYLDGWQRSGVGLRRLGLHSLTALAFLAYYRSPAAWAAIGYTGPLADRASVPRAAQARYEALVATPGTLPPGARAASAP